MKKTILVLSLASFISLSSVCGALVQNFKTDDSGGGTISPSSTLSVTLSSLVADGVTFDAILTVNGSGDLNMNSLGVGVTAGGSDLVNAGEFITFSMAISNVSGGTIAFDGFTEVNYSNFTGTDSGVLSVDSDIGTTGDNFFTTMLGGDVEDISATSPTMFSAIASAGSGAANSFRMDDVTGSFTGTAVPEPSSTVLLGLAGLATLLRRRR